MIPDLGSSFIDEFTEGLEKSAQFFYYVPGTASLLNNIGVFFQQLQQFDKALLYYDRSIGYFGNTDFTSFNMGLCYYFKTDIKKALSCMEEACELSVGDDIVIDGWISKINREIK